MRLSLRTGNSAAGANLNTDSVTRGSATEIASNFVLSPRRRNVHRVRRSFVLRLLRCSDGQQSSAWHVHVTANILVHQFPSTAAFRFQAIQFECLRCFQLKDGFLFQPEATVHGLLWKRRSGTTSDAGRDSTIVFGSVMCCHSLCCSFILVRDVFPSGELVTLLSCGAGLPGETSETRQQLHEENSAQADRTDHPKGIWIKPLYEECIVPVQQKDKNSDLANQALNVRVGFQRVQGVFGQ